MAKPKNLQRASEIKQVVAGIFSRKGYYGTSMREIGRAVGLNQSSLYHYFKCKEDILFHLMNDAMDEALEVLREICSSDLSPEDKMKRVLGFYAQYYAGDQDRLNLLVNEMHALGKEYRAILIRKERLYVQLIKSILEDLESQGKMRAIHPTIATFAFFGMVHYTTKWYHEGGEIGLEELTRSFLELFTKGVLADGVTRKE